MFYLYSDTLTINLANNLTISNADKLLINDIYKSYPKINDLNNNMIISQQNTPRPSGYVFNDIVNFTIGSNKKNEKDLDYTNLPNSFINLFKYQNRMNKDI